MFITIIAITIVMIYIFVYKCQIFVLYFFRIILCNQYYGANACLRQKR